MKFSHRVVLGLVAAVIGTLPFVGGESGGNPPAASAPPLLAVEAFGPVGLADPMLPPPTACQLTAHAMKLSAILSAQEEFWAAVANCRNGPEFGDCVDEAEEERSDAIELAFDQHEARLALCPLLGQGKYDPVIDPNDFSANVTNQFFPIIPGRTLKYSKMTSEGLEEVEVTHLMRVVDINGVPCAAVRDVEKLNGNVVEDTEDWFSQKADGVVWYMGEISMSYDEDGFLESIDGSWRFGTDGAKPGIIMLAMPFVGAIYRQEFFLGEAEDIGKVVSLNNTVTVPAGTFMGCAETEDSSPLEPGNFERKFYAPGVGLIKEFDPGSGESLELQMIIN
jgi:hypothetical protein